jgi:murein L,D-transpeptidase YcbB/YkuD
MNSKFWAYQVIAGAATAVLLVSSCGVSAEPIHSQNPSASKHAPKVTVRTSPHTARLVPAPALRGSLRERPAHERIPVPHHKPKDRTKQAALPDRAAVEGDKSAAPKPAADTKPTTVETKPTTETKIETKSSVETKPAADTKPGLLGEEIPTPGRSIFMADVLVGQKLKELFTKKLDRFISRKRDIASVEAYYKDKGYAPIWIGNGAPNLRTTAATTVMRSAEVDGLDPARFHIPDFKATGGDPEKLAEAELKFTEAVLAYARQAQAGRFSAQRISNDIESAQALPDAADVLRRLANASNTAAALQSYNPPQAGYKALKAKLAELRTNPTKVETAIIPAGPMLKPGARDPRVPLLRKRLGLAGADSNLTYDAHLVAAVKKFQAENGARPSGVIGKFTLEKLNGVPHGNPIDIVIANMERWRWLPRDLGHSYVMVDIPDYSLKVVHNGKEVWETRVVVGKPATPTPLFSAQIDNILLNPTWHVPESIIYNEYLPALQRDPRILERMGLVLERGPDGKPVVRQPPGEENALGRMKFNFPNRFQVYLHDTPQKNLFKLSKRAFSHGCMRVEEPAKFGEVLLALSSPQEHYSEERLKQAWGGPEQWLRLRPKIPVHLTYLTAYVNDQGKLVIRDDIYGFDKKMTAMLKGDERTLAALEAKDDQKKPEISVEQRRELERYVDGSGPSFGPAPTFGPARSTPRSARGFLDQIFR